LVERRRFVLDVVKALHVPPAGAPHPLPSFWIVEELTPSACAPRMVVGAPPSLVPSSSTQFVRPLNRDTLVRAIYDAMVKGGVLLVTEKPLTSNSDVNRYFIDFYYDFKRRNGYSEQQIARKREALENVETFFQWYNFAGFMAVKKG
jgi:hypothetical protein